MKLICVIYIIYISNAYSLSVGRFNCSGEKKKCDEVRSYTKRSLKNVSDLESAKHVLGIVAKELNLKELFFYFYKNNGSKKVALEINCKKIIKNIDYIGDNKLNVDLSIYENLIFKKEIVKKIYSDLRNVSKGKYRIKVVKDDLENHIDLKVYLAQKSKTYVSDYSIKSNSEYLHSKTDNLIRKLLKTKSTLPIIEDALEELKIDLKKMGYFSLEYKVDLFENEGAQRLVVNIDNEERFLFRINNNSFFSNSQIRSNLKEQIMLLGQDVSVAKIIELVESQYVQNGFEDVEVTATKRDIKSNKDEDMTMYEININEGDRYKINEIIFMGNSILSDEKIQKQIDKVMEKDKSFLFWDVRNQLVFKQIIEDYYFNQGLLTASVVSYSFKIDKIKKRVSLLFRIKEGQRYRIRNFRLSKESRKYKEELSNRVYNIKSKFFKPIEFSKDLKIATEFFKEKGYLNSNVLFLNDQELVRYQDNAPIVDIYLPVSLEDKVIINKVFLIGNLYTKDKFLKREITFKKNDVLTKSKLEQTRSNLRYTGLFDSVKIDYKKRTDGKYDVLVIVKEADFGVVEIAPGYRTDLGVKLYSSVSYTNLGGMGRGLSLSSLINRRTELDSIDSERREEVEQLWEYELNLNYSENKVFYSLVDMSTSLSTMRKRYFSFDAIINSYSLTFTKKSFSWLTSSMKYQLDDISQFNSTLDIGADSFRIGSILPSFVFDFRDSRINPRKGSFFQLSGEVANSALGSQFNEELRIDYNKAVLRTRFYFPYERLVFASSFSFGYQENNAQESQPGNAYIPNIRVFRLSGVDLVRGFDDQEINALDNGEDISSVLIRQQAYMVNIKIEPRYFFSDQTALGLFYDAGRISQDSIDGNDLRSSVGLSIKYLTPVGSLAFDYGYKLQRRRMNNGALESPGRFHLSIGFF